MLVSIENRSDTLVLLRLNSGVTRHLAPGEVAEVEPVEVKGNASIDRLAERRLISVDTGEAPAEAPGGEGGEAGESGEPAEAAPRARVRKR
jgi:hypothetical protein